MVSPPVAPVDKENPYTTWAMIGPRCSVLMGAIGSGERVRPYDECNPARWAQDAAAQYCAAVQYWHGLAPVLRNNTCRVARYARARKWAPTRGDRRFSGRVRAHDPHATQASNGQSRSALTGRTRRAGAHSQAITARAPCRADVKPGIHHLGDATVRHFLCDSIRGRLLSEESE